MNMQRISLVLIMAAFLAGAFVSVLDPAEVNWSWMLPILLLGIGGLWGFRTAHHKQASAGHRVSSDMDTLATSLQNISRNLEEMNQRKSDLPVYEARFEIDRVFREDLNDFANARETMIHVFGMQKYADVMSAFAAGERYINRVWSASTDGYETEVHRYLERARNQFSEALNLFNTLQADTRSHGAGSKG